MHTNIKRKYELIYNLLPFAFAGVVSSHVWPVRSQGNNTQLEEVHPVNIFYTNKYTKCSLPTLANYHSALRY
jgi:hypothetical protein